MKKMKTPRQRTHTEAHHKLFLAWVILILTSILCISLVSADVWDNTIYYYNFSENAGTNAEESVARATNLTIPNSWTTGILNSAYHPTGASGIDSGINLDDSHGANEAISINFWINTTDIEHGDFIMCTIHSGVNGQLSLYTEGTTKIRTIIYDTEEKLYDILILANQYQMVTMVANSSEMKWYLNGVLNTTISLLNYAWSDNNLHLWERDNGVSDLTVGGFDEFGIWNKVLTPSEITELYNGGSGLDYGGVPTVPSVNIDLISPEDEAALSVIGTNFTVNYSVANANLTNATYYLWNSTGLFNNSVFVLITGNTTNSSIGYIDDFVLGDYEWNVLACYSNITFSNCSFANNNYSFGVGASIDVENYNNNTYETSSETFITNLTLLSGTNFYDAQIDYNGTLYEGTIIDLGGGNYSINAALDIPLINVVSLLYDWHWKLTYEKADGTFVFQNLSTHEQNVSQISLFTSTCTAGENLTLNFTSYDEGDLSMIADFGFYATFEYWLGTGSIRKNISVSNSSVEDNIFFCIYPNNYTYYSDAKIQYEKTGFIKRSHYLINSSLTNTTNALGLYLLNSSASTSFIINIIDEVQFPVTNAYIYIQRYYPGSGIFHTVEMGRTDSSGNTIGHFEAETEDYKIIVFKEGVILYESDMQKVFCGETPCTLNFQIQAAAPTVWQNIGDLANLIWSLTYNEVTKFWIYTYVDTSGTTNFGRLLVYTEGGKGRIIICNKTDTSSAATLTCNVTGYEGTIYAEVYIKRSPEILVWLESIVEKLSKAIFGMEGLFWATMIILLIGLIGIWNPSVGIIMMIAGVILINFLQLASLGTVAIMGIVAIGGILLWEMKKP